MKFNSYIFMLLFLPLTLLGYFGLNHFRKEKCATAYLVGMSLWFYGYNNIYFLYMLIISVLMNFGLVHIIRKKRDMQRKLLMILGVIFNLGILFCFKYYNFFISNMNQIFQTDLGFLELGLPLGISFYTFQQLSYVIDSYRDECEEYSLLEYASYVTFFPQLIAGPIVYHSELLPEFRKKENKKLRPENFSKGIYAFSMGLAKKVLIADTLSPIVAIVFDKSFNLNTNTTLLGMICYSLQLYFDFSGYCDMAIGIGYMFNVELPVNFNSPYKAASISEFWDRWHMTLTRFFTKYVYIPLGGNRKGRVRRDINVLIVFFLSGLWHGAAWNFVLWGAIHGFLQVIDKYIGRLWRFIPKFIRVAITFLVVTLLWSAFRITYWQYELELIGFLRDFNFGPLYHDILEYFSNVFGVYLIGRILPGDIITANLELITYAFVGGLLAIVFFTKNTKERVSAMKYSAGEMMISIGLTIVSILSLTGVSEFLYFNF